MGDYKELGNFVLCAISACNVPSPDSVATDFFVVFNFWPIYLGFVMLGFTLTKCNYVFLLLTVTNYLDNTLNYLLREGIGKSDNFQLPSCPILVDQMPALASEKVVCLYTVAWFLVIYAYPTAPGKSNIVLLNFCAVLALFSRCYLGFSTPLQMVVGAGIGASEGIILSFIYYYLKIHRLDIVLVNLMTRYYRFFADQELESISTEDLESRSVYMDCHTCHMTRKTTVECTNHKPLL